MRLIFYYKSIGDLIMKHLFLLHTLAFTIYSTSLQGMANKQDVIIYNNLMKQQNNEELKIPGCVLFSYNIDQMNSQITYTFYKHTSKSDVPSKIKAKRFSYAYASDNYVKINISGHYLDKEEVGKLFLDPDETLAYPDTIEMRNDPIKNTFRDWYLYKDGNIIFNITSFTNITELNFYPNDIFKNVTKTVYHNGWYQEKIYPYANKENCSNFYYTWQHNIYRSIKYLCGLLIFIYIFKKIKPHLPF